MMKKKRNLDLIPEEFQTVGERTAIESKPQTVHVKPHNVRLTIGGNTVGTYHDSNFDVMGVDMASGPSKSVYAKVNVKATYGTGGGKTFQQPVKSTTTIKKKQ